MPKEIAKLAGEVAEAVDEVINDAAQDEAAQAAVEDAIEAAVEEREAAEEAAERIAEAALQAEVMRRFEDYKQEIEGWRAQVGNQMSQMLQEIQALTERVNNPPQITVTTVEAPLTEQPSILPNSEPKVETVAVTVNPAEKPDEPAAPTSPANQSRRRRFL